MYEIKEAGIESLQKIKNELLQKNDHKITVDYCCVEGFAVNEINTYTKTNSVELVVMGMQGAGYLVEKLIGSVTTSLLRESNCPVMAIDRKVKFRTPKKIVLACDYKHIKKSVLSPLKDIATLFNSHIYVLNVTSDREPVLTEVESAVSGISLDHAFDKINHSFDFTSNEDVVEGINDYIATRQMDMVVMVPRKHSILRNMFHEPNTKRIAFHTTVPVLALHEQ
jgi:nucleotide-binding universal stress UspA family protein